MAHEKINHHTYLYEHIEILISSYFGYRHIHYTVDCTIFINAECLS